MWQVVDFNSHAHVERDVLSEKYILLRIIFQLTCSRGAWLTDFLQAVNLIPISTHTLTWSVTKLLWTVLKKCKFQLTRSRGAWRREHWCMMTSHTFQLTRSRGAWLNIALIFLTASFISTHTLTWSVTLGIRFSVGENQFQLTRSRGAWRLALPVLTADNSISTHTLTWSVTVGSVQTLMREKFQLTRSRGAWLPKNRKIGLKTFYFNSHAHVERDSLR